jgi:hypothetical protein
MIDFVFSNAQIEIVICVKKENLTFETNYSEAIENGFKKQIFVKAPLRYFGIYTACFYKMKELDEKFTCYSRDV